MSIKLGIGECSGTSTTLARKLIMLTIRKKRKKMEGGQVIITYYTNEGPKQRYTLREEITKSGS